MATTYFRRDEFVKSTTGKLTGVAWKAAYESLRDKHPFEGATYKGKRPPPRRFEEHSLQPLLMWPSDKAPVTAYFWPQTGRVITATFFDTFQDHYDCIWHNIWVYDVS